MWVGVRRVFAVLISHLITAFRIIFIPGDINYPEIFNSTKQTTRSIPESRHMFKMAEGTVEPFGNLV
jgi:hypothetical protein